MIGEVEKDPWGLAFKIVTKRLVSRRKTPGLDNPDRVKYIVWSLFPHVEPFQTGDRSSCVVRREELFALEELKRAGGRLKENTAPEIDGSPNEILKEVIEAHPEILLEVFNFCLREGRFFADWKKQRLVLLRKGNKPPGDASSYRPICLLDTMGKHLEEMLLQSYRVTWLAGTVSRKTSFGFMKRDDQSCRYCASLVDNAEHTLFVRARWGVAREDVGRAVGAQLIPDMIVSPMLQSEQKWMLVGSFVTLVTKTRKLDGRA